MWHHKIKSLRGEKGKNKKYLPSATWKHSAKFMFAECQALGHSANVFMFAECPSA